MGRPRSKPVTLAGPDYTQLVSELQSTREIYAVQRKALENIKPFLLELHQQSVYLPPALAQRLADLLHPLLNTGDRRPTGRASQRSRAEKAAIVAEYDAGLAAGYGNAAAVTRKYTVSVHTINNWREQLQSGNMARDPAWMSTPDPFADALSRVSLPSSEQWQGKAGGGGR